MPGPESNTVTKVQSPAGNKSAGAWSEAPPQTWQEHSLLALVELSQELNVSLDLYGVAELGLLNFMGHLGTSQSALWYMREDSEDPALMRSFGLPEEVVTDLGSRVAARMLDFNTSDPLPRYPEELTEVLSSEDLEVVSRSGIRIFARLLARGKIVGVVALGARVGNEPYAPFQLKVLQASLHHLAVALENTGLYSSLFESHRRLRQANEYLQQLDRLKSEFYNNVDHELRTPLTIIVSYVEVLIQMQDMSEKAVELLGVTREQALKLKSMMTDLLDFSAIEERSLQATLTDGSVIGPVVNYYRERRPGVAAGLRELDLDARPGVGPARFDRQMLRRVLDGLVDNATKFTPPGTRIVLRVREEPDWICVDVEDNGPGIPAKDLPELFEAFRQLDGSTTREVGGMGIGLALGKRLAEAMGGALEATSEVGRGTTFTVKLPCAR